MTKLNFFSVLGVLFLISMAFFIAGVLLNNKVEWINTATTISFVVTLVSVPLLSLYSFIKNKLKK